MVSYNPGQEGVGKKLVRGTIWVSVARVVSASLRFAARLGLARLLQPADFGLVAIGFLVITVVDVVPTMGFRKALIVHREEEKRVADTTTALVIPTDFLLFLLVFLAAPYVAAFFQDPAAIPVVRMLALILLVDAIGHVPIALIERRLEFRKLALPSILGDAAYVPVALWLAVKGAGVWSIVWAELISRFVFMVGTVYASRYRPAFVVDARIARELLRFGKYMVLMALGVIVYSNLDNAIVGRILGTTVLGFYAVAFSIVDFPRKALAEILSRVLLPGYAYLQMDSARLADAWLKSLSFISLLIFPIFFGLFAISPTFVRVVLGPGWTETIVIIQALCLTTLTRALVTPCSDVLAARDRPEATAWLTTLHVLIMSLTTVPLTLAWGVLGTIAAVTLSGLLDYGVQFVTSARLVGVPLHRALESMKPAMFASTVMLGAVGLVQAFTGPLSGFGAMLGLIAVVGLGMFVYGFCILFLDKALAYQMQSIFPISLQALRRLGRPPTSIS